MPVQHLDKISTIKKVKRSFDYWLTVVWQLADGRLIIDAKMELNQQ